jgi:hypothetical protein
MAEVKVVLRRGKGDRSKYLYANVYDANTGEILIAADAEYVIQSLKEHKHTIVDLEME